MTKFQAPDKFQTPNSKLQTFGAWDLVLGAYLVLGAWCLVLA
jgi:hypothetical protein